MLEEAASTAIAEELRTRLRGPVLGSADEDYEKARAIFNAGITARPAVIAQCRTPEEVATALAFAREDGLDIAVRSGGPTRRG